MITITKNVLVKQAREKDKKKKHVELKTGFVDFTILCKDLLFLQGNVVYKSRKLAKFTGFYARFHQLLSFLQEPWYDQETMFIV